MKKLTAITIKKSGDGTLYDGGGLMLKKKSDSGKWVWRYTHLKRKRDMGLGSWPSVSLAEARKMRDKYAQQLAQGIDPLNQRREEQEAALAELERDDPTYETLVHLVFEAKRATLRESGNRGRWLSPLITHAIPKIGMKRGSKLTRHDIHDVLKPILRDKHLTAEKVVKRTALLMAWMPPPGGIAMCQCDACEAITEGESIHV